MADNEQDWRVRLHLPAESTALYKTAESKAGNSILFPLVATDGIIFPYTPTIGVQYSARYENYDLTHSNYRGYFYTGSQVENIMITATFTAQDKKEAEYLLAAMHFLRTCTKMFYGKDVNAGTPPPVVMLTGLGEYNFNNHPCVITMLSFNLPNDVDYIPAGVSSQYVESPIPKVKEKPVSQFSASSVSRLVLSKLFPGAEKKKPDKKEPPKATSTSASTVHTDATYVPTKIDISFTMIPIQTRKQVSEEFSLEDYASGKLLKKGFW